MIKLEALQPNASVRGLLPDSLVTVVSVQWFGSEALEPTRGPTARSPTSCSIGTTSLSCRGFRANEVRSLLGVIAYNLGNLLRRLVLPLAIQSWSLTSLQQRLFKTGSRLIRYARYFILQLAESHLKPRLFRQIMGRIERLAWHPT